MGIARKVIEWVDNSMENIDKSKHPIAKSFGAGFVEGAIDGAIIAYPMLVAACIIAGKKLAKYEEN